MTSARGRWEKRTRTVDIEITAGPEGVEVTGVHDPELAAVRSIGADALPPEPCYGCACCTSWATMLEQLRAAAAAHKNPHPLLGNRCPTEQCLICALGVTW